MSGDVVAELRGWAQDVQTAAFWRGSEGGEAGEALAAFFTKTADLITSQAAEIDRLREERDEIDRVRVEQSTRLLRRAETAERLLAEARAEIERMTPQFVAYDYLEAPCRREQAEEHLGSIISAYDANTGAEPSVSVLDRAIDAARTLSNGGENGR